jgi:hypothetical protein
MGDLSDFEREQMFVSHLAGAYDKTATLLGISVTVSKVMSTYTNCGKAASTRGTLGKN